MWTRIRKSKITFLLVGVFLTFSMMLMSPRKIVCASVRDNAGDFYHSYGNEAVFLASSQTDGIIYCATKGVIATTGTRYQTIGWRMTVTDGAGNGMQTIYYALGGNYISSISTVKEGPYEYNLYGVSLSTVKSRLSVSARNALDAGNCRMILDACMVVRNGDRLSGSMNDYGGFEERVYTDYYGIAGAASWTAASKEELHSYFNKSVQGLFCSVSVSGDYGISSTSGAGIYCYGTYVEIAAVTKRGYLFSYWSGGGASWRFGFYVDGNKSFYANSRPMETMVRYWRNMDDHDQVAQNVNYVYDRGNQYFGQNIAWKWIGHHIEGFGNDRKDQVRYEPGQTVSNDWILDKHPGTDLYTIWDINHYRIIYDGNGATGGKMPEENYIYTDTMVLPENGYEKNDRPCTFVGWSLSPDSLREEYRVGESLALSDLAARCNLEYENGSITLYAIWDFAPEILSGDLYYSYMDAKAGMISPEEISRYVRCPDREDGVLPLSMEEKMTLNEDGLEVGYWYIKDYDGDCWQAVVDEAVSRGIDETEVSLILLAIDHAGNVTEAEIRVYLVDTTVHLGMDCYGRVRFINKEYLYGEDGLRSEDAGGLNEKSIWRLREDYLEALKQACAKR